MADVKLVKAIVRGPASYFGANGTLYAPGSVVVVPEDQVSDDDTITERVKVQDRFGREQTVDVLRQVKFRPVSAAAPATASADGPDNVNTGDLLKKSVDDIVAEINSGLLDQHLSAIEQAEIAGKGRKGVQEAITARLADIQRG